MTPTIQQQAVMDLFESQFGPENGDRQAIFIDAVAGAGKTSLLMMLVDVILKIKREQPSRDIKGVAVSFNTHIKKELESRLDKKGANGYMQSKTTNGLGFAILNAVAGNGGLPKTKLDAKKYTAICKSEFEARGHFRPAWKLINAAVKLADFCRLTMVEPTEANMISIILHYDLSKECDILDPNWDDIWQSARDAIGTGIREYRRTGIIDFTDQIYLPLKLNLASPIYDVIFVDEAQDLNQVRLQLILQSIKKNGQLVFVGDPFQAIQGFAGSDTNSVETIVKATNAIMMPLSVCFRSDANIISMAQQIVPHIEARESAPEGNVEVIKEGDFLSMLHEGEMDRYGNLTKDPSFIMCRTKAPLASKCMACLRAGKTAVIRGKAIGDMLMGLIEKFAKVKGIRDFERASLDDLKEGAEIYQDRQAKKIGLSDDADEKLNELYDTMETFWVLVEAYIDQEQGGFSVSRLQTFIDGMFTDSDKTAITFSTVHKAKGLEYEDVFIIEPHLMPLKYAKLDWQIQQEWNILYVALTRAKHNLYFVGSVPGGLLMPGEELVEDLEQLELVEVAEEIAEPSIAILEPVEAIQEDEIVEPVNIETKRKGGRPKGSTKAAKGEKTAREINTYLQMSMSPEMKDKLLIMMENYNDNAEESLDMSKLLLQIIQESPLFQQAEQEYEAGIRPINKKKHMASFSHMHRKEVFTMGFNAENRLLKQEGKRRCSDCKDIFPATTKHFGLKGDGRFEAICNNCRNKQRRERSARKRGYSVIRPARKASDEVTRQRIAIIRKTILHDIVIWTIQEPHRIVLFQDIWDVFYGLVYEKERKVRDDRKLCVRCRELGRKYWHPLSDYRKDSDIHCKICHKEEVLSSILSQEAMQVLDGLSSDLDMDNISVIEMLIQERAEKRD